MEPKPKGTSANTVESVHAAVMKNYKLIENWVEFGQIRTDIEEQKKGGTAPPPTVTSYAGARVKIDRLEWLMIW